MYASFRKIETQKYLYQTPAGNLTHFIISDFKFSDEKKEETIKNKSQDDSINQDILRNTNPEKQMLKSRERLDKLKKLTEKLRTPSGVADIESEPAYKRADLDLNEENDIKDDSKIILDNNKGDIQIKEDNSFLHDNID